MAATAILGVYASKSALDSAHSSGNTKGDTYIVGSGIPYDLYSWSGSAFVKGDKVSDQATDLTTSIPVDDLTDLSFEGKDGKTLKIRKGLHLGEIHFYVPAE